MNDEVRLAQIVLMSPRDLMPARFVRMEHDGEMRTRQFLGRVELLDPAVAENNDEFHQRFPFPAANERSVEEGAS
jgi:hypothetical protein